VAAPPNDRDIKRPMKPGIIATFVGLAAAAGATQLSLVNSLLDDIYPKDAARAEALRLCILANPNFNRLDSAARDACYHHAVGEQASVPSAPPQDLKTSNQVDLRQSAAMGSHIARNDIRLNQQADHSLR
jgi:hypothetical protein